MSELPYEDRYKMCASPEEVLAHFGRPRAELATLADNHIQAVQAWLSTRTPDAKRFEGRGVRAGSSGLGVPLLNLALGSHYPAETNQEFIETEIESVKTFYTYRGVPWSWWLGPNPQPADMPERLLRHGLRYNMRPTMVASLPPSLPKLPNHIEVFQAQNYTDLASASTIRRVAFGFPEGVGENYFEVMAQNWLDRQSSRLYLARVKDGPPAAIGTLIMGAGLPGIYAMATLPNWRRHGLGTAILVSLLSEAIEMGHKLTVLTASQLGYPLYAKYGFRHIFNYLDYGPFRSGNGLLPISQKVLVDKFSTKKPDERRQNRNRNRKYRGEERRKVVNVNPPRRRPKHG
jgi:GNAT superfamily N-acetyltransferase